LAHLTSFRRITKFTTVYGSSTIQLPYLREGEMTSHIYGRNTIAIL